MTPSPDLSRIQQSLRESRISISREYGALLSDLDFQKRFKESVRHHPVRWIGGAVAAGLLATIVGGGRRSRKTTTKETPSPVSPESGPLSKASWVLGTIEVGKLFYPIIRPVLVEFLSNATQSLLAKKNRRQG